MEKKEDERVDFAKRIAQEMLKLSSSHVHFILQEAYGDDLDWDEFEALLERIIGDP